MLLVCLSATIASAKPSDYDAVKRAKLVEWVEQLRVMADNAKQQAAAADAKLVESEALIIQGREEIVRLQVDITALDQYAKDQWLRADTAERSLAGEKLAHQKTLGRYHFLKGIAAGLQAACGGYIAFLALSILPIHYRLLGALAGAAVGFLLIWTFL